MKKKWIKKNYIYIYICLIINEVKLVDDYGFGL